MHDFPPEVTAYTPRETSRPDTRSPARFLWWMLRVNFDVLVVCSATGMMWLLPSALSPYLLGQAIDQGVLTGNFLATLFWSALLFVAILIGSVGGVLQHTYAVRAWLIAIYGTQKQATRKATQLGHVLSRRLPTGEVMSISSSDSDIFGATFEVVARTLGAVGAFILVAILMLQTSPLLGLIVLIAAPVLVGAASPVMRPLNAARTAERTQNSELTGMATDIVSGLRILRGIGGEKTFGDNYSAQSQRVRHLGVTAGSWQAVVETLSVLLSGLLLVTLVWLGSHEMLAGRLTVGQLISFFGFAIFMVWPMQTFFELAQKWVQGLVSARKTIGLLGSEPPWPDGSGVLADRPTLTDELSGLVVRPGEFLAVVSSNPDETAALADRLGRYLPGGSELPGEDDEDLKGRAARRAEAERRRDRAERARQDADLARQPWGVSADGIDYADLKLADLRQRVLVSDTGSQLFAGTLQEALDPHGRHTRNEAEDVLWVAAADDVYAALPEGWQGRIDEKGRGLSGGQRQRLVLARALLIDPEVLVLVEPTSAVDAHTEATIAERLPAHRRGRTTVVMSASPLILHHADRVVLIEDGRQVADGDHRQLLAASAGYRRVVARGMEEQDDVD